MTVGPSDRPKVTQPAADMEVGDSNSGRPTAGGAGRPVNSAQFDTRSNPSEHKLLTPPQPSPPQKSDIQFQGIEASESKNP